MAERLGTVWQRSAAGWDARSLGKVTTVIGNCMWAGIGVLNDESPAGLVCQMFIPDAFDEFMVCVGEDAAVAICLQLWCFSCCLGWLNIKYFRTTQRSQLTFVTSHHEKIGVIYFFFSFFRLEKHHINFPTAAVSLSTCKPRCTRDCLG